MIGLSYTVHNTLTNEKRVFTQAADVMQYYVSWISNGGDTQDLIVQMSVTANVDLSNMDNMLRDHTDVTVNHQVLLSSISDSKLSINKTLNTNLHLEYHTPLPQRVYRAFKTDKPSSVVNIRLAV